VAAAEALAIAHGVVDVWAGPARGGDDDRLTQALLGWPAALLEMRDGWARVRLPDYEGWVAQDQLAPPPAPTAEVLAIGALAAPVYAASTDATLLGEVYLGTALPLLGHHADRWRVALPGGRHGWLDRAAGTPAPRGRPFAAQPASHVVAVAQQLLGTPYLWGGGTCRGIDCSALIQLAYRVSGHTLPRDADQQWAALHADVARAALRPGDLLFFARDGAVVHVALALGGQRLIHALGEPPRGVCVESLDLAAAEYNPRLAASFLGARRVIGDDAAAGMP
jgi:cell wall-associated NlpC family hydrolase